MANQAELARRLLAAFNDGDAEEACAVTAPDVEFVAIAEQVTGELPGGHDGLREWFRAMARTWEELHAEEAEPELEPIRDWPGAGHRARARVAVDGNDPRRG